MAQKFLQQSNGALQEVEAATSSSGASDAGKIPGLDSEGRIHTSMMPTGVAADVKVAVASEALSAYDAINIFDDSGTVKARKADASNGRRAHGFVKEAVTLGSNATVFLEGTIGGKTGLTPGAPEFLSGATAGATTETAPTTSGHIVQEVGCAVSETEISFEPQQPITLA